MMPAGTYYIGDLCYVMRPEWDEYCSIVITGLTIKDGEFELADGRKFATYSTMYGDGEYRTSEGRSVSVDSGMIGCIRVEDLSLGEEENIEDGIVVTFDQPFQTYECDGTIVIGFVRIDTEGQEYDEYYDDDDEDD